MEIHVGIKAPNFTLPSSSGRDVSLEDFMGTKVLIFFYPKDDTPGCTIEACGIRDEYENIKQKDTIVFGISADDLNSHHSFIKKFGLNFELLSDLDKEVSITYGAWGEKILYGKKSIGMKRMSFLINEEGVIAKIWKKVTPDKHASQILEAIS
ncbi:MAG: thioredoxin-dependent thiol peroxidase [Chloroflexi bacterium]|nr:thioredoxin-dependent thiol peroxidase [Chloroflexota bacterium]|tara:strand:- start:36526 stop:36984 length:459 start_codon:yes stop_codon:yes gene_type:complete